MLEVGSSFIFWPILYLEGWSSRLSYFIAVALQSKFKIHVCSFCRFLAFLKKVKPDCKLVKNRRSGDNLRAHLLLEDLLVQSHRILYPWAAADYILSRCFVITKKIIQGQHSKVLTGAGRVLQNGKLSLNTLSK